MTKILLADDSVTIQKVVELTFADQESEVTAVGDGAAALEKAQLQRPDIILSDVIMPGMNGYELCQSVKSDPNLKSIPFLFLKGTFESFDEDKARECGANGFIVKPFESQELIDKVKELVRSAGSAPAEEPAPAPEPEQPSAPPPQEAPPFAADAEPPSPAVEPPPPQPVPEPARTEEAVSASAPAAEESFDFSEEELVSDVAPPPRLPDEPALTPAETPAGDQEEDLWSEVSLREASSPLIEDKVLEDESFWGTPDDLERQQGEEEPAGEALLEEVQEPEFFDLGDDEMQPPPAEPSTASVAEPADALPAADAFFEPPAIEVAPPTPVASVEDVTAEEIDHIPTPVYAEASSVPEPPASAAADVSSSDLEKAISSKLEEAIRTVLGPAIEEAAGKIVEEVAWEVIPDLAEAMIRSEIERIKAENS